MYNDNNHDPHNTIILRCNYRVFSQHPDSSQMNETVENLVRKFRDQMDLAPMPSLYDSGDGMPFTAPRECFRHDNTFPEWDI